MLVAEQKEHSTMVKRNQLTIGMVCLLLAGSILPATVSVADVQHTFYVSPTGSDENPGTESEPFKTIRRAQDAVRKVNRQMTGGVVNMFG